MNDKLSKKILDQIDSDKIHPQPKWKFRAKNWIFWIFYSVFILVGGVGFSVAVFLTSSEDWEIHQYISDSPIKFFILSFPYFWAVIFFLFITFSYFNFRKTNRGYKFSFRKLFFISLTLTVIFGSVSYATGFAEKFEGYLQDHVKYYSEYRDRRMQMWNNPDEGILSGEISKIGDGYFEITDLGGESWKIYFDSETVFRGRKEFEIGSDIKIIGSAQSNKEFFAEDVRMWGGGTEMMNGRSGMGKGIGMRMGNGS